MWCKTRVNGISHNNNIKCVDSTIKYIDFESFNYAINHNIFSFFVFLVILIIYFYPYIISYNQLNYFYLKKKNKFI